MLIYINGAALSILFAYISSHIGRSRYLSKSAKKIFPKFFAFLAFLPLTLISAFRYNVGADFMTYVSIYKSQSFKETEPGFALLVKILHSLSENPQIFFVVTSFIICAGYYIAIYRESISPAYSIFIFFTTPTCFFNSMNLIRQNMAMALLLIAVSFYHKKNYKIAVLVIIISATMHNSALIAAIALLIIDQKKITPISGAMVMAAFAMFARFFSYILRRFIIQYTTYGRYFLYPDESNTYLSILIVLICFYIMFSYIYYKVKTVRSLHIAFSALVYGLIIGFSVSTIVIPANRLMYYSESILVLYVPEAIKQINRRYVRNIMYVVVTAAYVLKIIIFFRSYYYLACTQYRSIWSTR